MADEVTDEVADKMADKVTDEVAGELAGEDIDWLSTKDAASRLGVTLRSLYKFIDEGDLAAYRIGRVIRLKRDDIDSYIERCRILPGDLVHLHLPGKGDDDSI